MFQRLLLSWLLAAQVQVQQTEFESKLQQLLDRQVKEEQRQIINSKLQSTREEIKSDYVPSPHGEFAIIKQDLMSLDPAVRPFTRYMTSAFINPGREVVDLVDYQTDQGGREVGLIPDPANPFIAQVARTEIHRWNLANRIASFGLNSVSQAGEIVLPEIVPGTNGRIIRFQLDAYYIRQETWEWFVAQEPYFRHISDQETYKLCGSYRPLIRTDWFLPASFADP